MLEFDINGLLKLLASGIFYCARHLRQQQRPRNNRITGKVSIPRRVIDRKKNRKIIHCPMLFIMGEANPFFTIAGGRPAAGYFFLRRQEKATKKKAPPVCRATLQVAYPR